MRQAEQTTEMEAVDRRYQEAIESLRTRNADAVGLELERLVACGARAVIARSLNETERLATNDNQGYASFYQLVRAGIRIPEENHWDGWRSQADEFFFPYYKEEIRFAALTLDGLGLPHYGDAFLVLRDDMIAYRTTIFESNTTAFARTESLTLDNAPSKILGRRSLWGARGKLAVAKHHAELAPDTASGKFAALILSPGNTQAEDCFLEAHVYGSITARTFERVIVQRQRGRGMLRVLVEQFEKLNVPLDVAVES